MSASNVSLPDETGRFGQFGGRYVAETLMPLVLDLERDGLDLAIRHGPASLAGPLYPEGIPIVTELTKAAPFYPAEEYHQDFYKKNPIRYKFYKFNCGRAQRLEEVWGAR